MLSRNTVRTTFELERVIEPVYTGGSVALDETGCILATCLGEDAVLTDLRTGEQLARIEGDGEIITSLCRESPFKISSFNSNPR
jgi:U3 small nucleolar RNA-associated protein 13